MRKVLLILLFYLSSIAHSHAREPCVLGRDMPYRIPIQGVIFVGLLDPQCFGVYQDGIMVRYDEEQLFFGWMSSGAPRLETPVTLPQNGPHIIWEKKRMHFSKSVPVYVRGRKMGSPMPFSWFFNGGHAIHEGRTALRNASHGCVRLEPWAARALYHRFRKDELQVVIAYDQKSLLREWR